MYRDFSTEAPGKEISLVPLWHRRIWGGTMGLKPPRILKNLLTDTQIKQL